MKETDMNWYKRSQYANTTKGIWHLPDDLDYMGEDPQDRIDNLRRKKTNIGPEMYPQDSTHPYQVMPEYEIRKKQYQQRIGRYKKLHDLYEKIEKNKETILTLKDQRKQLVEQWHSTEQIDKKTLSDINEKIKKEEDNISKARTRMRL